MRIRTRRITLLTLRPEEACGAGVCSTELGFESESVASTSVLA